MFNQQASGLIGPIGVSVQCHAEAERHQEIVIVYRQLITIVLVSVLHRKFADVLDSSAKVNVTLL